MHNYDVLDCMHMQATDECTRLRRVHAQQLKLAARILLAQDPGRCCDSPPKELHHSSCTTATQTEPGTAVETAAVELPGPGLTLAIGAQARMPAGA